MRLSQAPDPLQVGIGTIAYAIVSALKDSPFKKHAHYSEVLQDFIFELFDAGKMDFASACSITLSKQWSDQVWNLIFMEMSIQPMLMVGI